jgi:peptide deformylase
MDHLDGILIIDRIPKDQRKEALRILREGADALEPRAVATR